jgi:hypothetical protein
MRRVPLLILALLATAVAGLLPAGAASAAKRKKAKPAPAVTFVSPMRVRAGSTLTLRGRNFSPSRRRNTVIFSTPGGRSIFVKPRSASRRKLVVTVPTSIDRFLSRDSAGRLKPLRFGLRVAAGRFSKRTPRRLSPVVTPFDRRALAPAPSAGNPAPAAPRPAAPKPVTPPKPPDCDNDGIPNSSDTSSDGDLLGDAQERTLKTDPCRADTDGDGVDDGFELRSAVDLNNDEYQDPNDSLPYPGKRPYPNPLDSTDGNTDYDGDTLSQKLEQSLWKFSTTPASRTLSPLTYSDGLQHSIYEHRSGQGDRRFPSLAAAGYDKQQSFVAWATGAGYRQIHVDVHHADKPAGLYGLFDANLDGTETADEQVHFDRDGSGFLSDAERDEDADGLSNREENTGRAVARWWASCYGEEKPYYVTYGDPSPFDPDSDGDGVRDGADDQDHDDVPNVMELSRMAASGFDDTERGAECRVNKALRETLGQQEAPVYHHSDAYGRLNPFNPCLPDPRSRTCKRYVEFESPWAPFDESIDWFSLN